MDILYIWREKTKKCTLARHQSCNKSADYFLDKSIIWSIQYSLGWSHQIFGIFAWTLTKTMNQLSKLVDQLIVIALNTPYCPDWTLHPGTCCWCWSWWSQYLRKWHPDSSESQGNKKRNDWLQIVDIHNYLNYRDKLASVFLIHLYNSNDIKWNDPNNQWLVNNPPSEPYLLCASESEGESRQKALQHSKQTNQLGTNND